MIEHAALIQEFVARKEQILNLEIRLFVLVLVFQVVFIFFYVVSLDSLRNQLSKALVALSCFLLLFFEMLAVNGKMGLISGYLRQMESYMATIGLPGVVWETRALDAIIFCPGNAFTLPATLVLLLLFSQTLYAVHFSAALCVSSRFQTRLITLCVGLVLIVLSVKSLTVDFGRQLPAVF